MNRIHCILLAAGLTFGVGQASAQDAVSKGLTGDRAVPALDCNKAAEGTKDCMDKPRAKKSKPMKKSAKTNDALGAVKANDTKR